MNLHKKLRMLQMRRCKNWLRKRAWFYVCCPPSWYIQSIITYMWPIKTLDLAFTTYSMYNRFFLENVDNFVLKLPIIYFSRTIVFIAEFKLSSHFYGIFRSCSCSTFEISRAFCQSQLRSVLTQLPSQDCRTHFLPSNSTKANIEFCDNLSVVSS